MPRNDATANPNKVVPQQNERHVTGSVHVRGELEAYPPPHLVDKHDAERKEDNARERMKFIVEILTLLAVGIYAGLTWWQGCSTRTAAYAARDSAAIAAKTMKIDQRAWVAATIGIRADSPSIVTGTTLTADVSYKNTGKTPARDMFGVSVVKIVPNGQQPDFQYYGAIYFRTGVVLPNDSQPVEHSIPWRLSADEYGQLKDNKAYIVAYTKITYYDVFNVAHWIQRCTWKSLRTEVLIGKECSKYNQIDTN